jgi:hypothetical protein
LQSGLSLRRNVREAAALEKRKAVRRIQVLKLARKWRVGLDNYMPAISIILIAPRALACILLAGCLVGCDKSPNNKSRDPLNPASAIQVKEAKQRFHLLRTGMTDGQVFTNLGLADCYGSCMADAGGPTSFFRVSYTLRNGQDLHLFHDTNGLVEAWLGEAIWKRDKKVQTP